MSDIQDQIKRNRENAAVQEMNKALSASDTQPGTGEVRSGGTSCWPAPSKELPIFGEPVQKHVQNLNGAGAPK